MKQQIVTETVRGLDDFYFTIQDYALDGGKRVIAQANEHLHQRHNVGVVPEELRKYPFREITLWYPGR